MSHPFEDHGAAPAHGRRSRLFPGLDALVMSALTLWIGVEFSATVRAGALVVLGLVGATLLVASARASSPGRPSRQLVLYGAATAGLIGVVGLGALAGWSAWGDPLALGAFYFVACHAALLAKAARSR
ncbi:hypothetical protein [Miltoncostaea oceani]|uniref:hypothetical protein n=1 Tax=Miltoncostaea oceani TaxID=2843216 RepID=UPI001C3D2BB6|nr:hypothetical protein [Miltoncostaea oceani]